METQKAIFLKRIRIYRLACIFGFVSFVFAIVLAMLLNMPVGVQAGVYNDSYSYEDNFEDTSGLDLEKTEGFEVIDGALLAEEPSAVAVSECISLPQPEGGTFINWSFLELSLAEAGAGSNTLEIQDCDGDTLKTINNLPDGESSIDLSMLTAPSIRLILSVDTAGVRLIYWHIYGVADGVTSIQIAPNSDKVDAGDTVTFTVTISTSGAKIRGPVLYFSLDAINGLNTPDIDDGLAEDAEVDYGSGVKKYRPLEFVSASKGPDGALPTTPGPGATSGEVVWELGDLSAGLLDNVYITMLVPKGYINAKQFAAKAVLEHGASSGVHSMRMREEAVSDPVTVSSVSVSIHQITTAYGNVRPGAENIYDCYFYTPHTPPVDNPSDIEDITFTITGTGTCLPLFRDIRVLSDYSYQIVDTPEQDAPVTPDDPVIVHIDRASFYDISTRVYIYYDISYECNDGDITGTSSKMASGNPLWEHTAYYNHRAVIETCRLGYNLIHRIMNGTYPGDYDIWPAWPEYYINSRSSLRAGEYFTTWSPYGDAGQRSHTVTLDHTYNLMEIPEGITFHGVRKRGGLTRLFKDCSSTAPLPTDPAFNHNLDPPHPAWKSVETQWKDAPFSNPPDTNDPEAIVSPGCQILVVKDIDSPAGQVPDYGSWTPHFLWRVCDGQYGCTELPEGTAMELVRGTIFTYETFTNPEGVVHECITYNGSTLYKEKRSWPKVYTWAEEDQVPAGMSARIVLNPENQNHASQWVDGHWVINLYRVREYIYLEGITGEVLKDGNIPNPDLNIIGESCSLADDITFHLPDPEACMEAASEDDMACMAWWEVAPACQPSNGWGHKVEGDWSYDDYVQIYRFRLNVPILNKTPANTELDFVAQVRTKDMAAKGADNAVDTSRWAEANYEAATSVTVFELPGLDVEKAGPVAKKPGDTVTYTLNVKNCGNTPNDGWYLVDWLPREGVNGSEFTPEHGKVYLDKQADDVIVEYTDEDSCFTAPLECTWTEMPLKETTRTGYITESIDPVDANASCLRLRRRPGSTAHFNPAQIILGALDLIIPGDVTLNGKRIYNRALAGSSKGFGATSDLPPLETVNVRTKVSPEVFVDIEKGFKVDSNLAGSIQWTLRVHNKSGSTATGIDVIDDLAEELIYEGIIGMLPSGWEIFKEPEIGGQNGRLHIIIPELGPDDGTYGTGNDEGEIAFSSRVTDDIKLGAVIENCASATPGNGTGNEDCDSIIVPWLEINKAQDALDRIHETSATEVYTRDIIGYIITIKNGSDNAVYLKVHDNLDDYLEYIPDTFVVNGALASNEYVSNGVVDYQYPDPVAPGADLTLKLKVQIKKGAPHNHVIENRAQVNACRELSDPSSCFITLETLPVYSLVFKPCEGDFDADGDVDGSDLAVFAEDFGRTDCPAP